MRWTRWTCLPDDKRVDDQDQPDLRISTSDGGTLRVHRDRATRLTCLDLENPAGELVASRVLDRDDARRLAETLTAAWEDAQTSDLPVVVDVSAVLGRD